jgi:hypothetical protein
MNDFPWTIFFVLLAGSIVGGVAVLPYALGLNKNSISAETQAKIKLPKPVLMVVSVIQTGVLMGVAAFLGLLAARQVGLQMPILKAMVAGQPVGDALLRILPVALLATIIVGAVMYMIERYLFMPKLPQELLTLDTRTSFWKKLLACLYGGFDEEILTRLFMVSGFAWLAGLVWKSPSGTPADGAFWMAIILSALLFGAGHLPATGAVTKLTPFLVARALLINGIPGLAFGYLYWQYGLVAAMLAHFILDLFIHLVYTPATRPQETNSTLQIS